MVVDQARRSGPDPLALTALTVSVSTVMLFAACHALGVPLTGYDPRTWIALVALGVVSQLGGYLAITYALGHLPATVTGVALVAQGPLTALLAVPLLGEPLAAAQVAGGAFVLTGIGIVVRGDARARPAPPRGTTRPLEPEMAGTATSSGFP